MATTSTPSPPSVYFRSISSIPSLNHLCRHLFWPPAMAVLQHEMRHLDGPFVLKQPKLPIATDLFMGPIQLLFEPKPQDSSHSYAFYLICFTVITGPRYPPTWLYPFTLTIFHLSTAFAECSNNPASLPPPLCLLNTTYSLRYVTLSLSYHLHYLFTISTVTKMLVPPSILSHSLRKPTVERIILPLLPKLDVSLNARQCYFQQLIAA